LQATPTTKQISFTELEDAISTTVGSAINFNQTSVPSGADDPGIYFVQTGTYRGVYAWTGQEAVLLAPFLQDGDWPV
jgi:hypothetical protein